MCEQSCDHSNLHRLEDPNHQILFFSLFGSVLDWDVSKF